MREVRWVEVRGYFIIPCGPSACLSSTPRGSHGERAVHGHRVLHSNRDSHPATDGSATRSSGARAAPACAARRARQVRARLLRDGASGGSRPTDGKCDAERRLGWKEATCRRRAAERRAAVERAVDGRRAAPRVRVRLAPSAGGGARATSRTPSRSPFTDVLNTRSDVLGHVLAARRGRPRPRSAGARRWRARRQLRGGERGADAPAVTVSDGAPPTATGASRRRTRGAPRRADPAAAADGRRRGGGARAHARAPPCARRRRARRRRCDALRPC